MGWTWEKLKKEVDHAHREFFQKRGIDPSSLNKDFLFGFSANKRESSRYSNDQPKRQSSRGRRRSSN